MLAGQSAFAVSEASHAAQAASSRSVFASGQQPSQLSPASQPAPPSAVVGVTTKLLGAVEENQVIIDPFAMNGLPCAVRHLGQEWTAGGETSICIYASMAVLSFETSCAFSTSYKAATDTVATKEVISATGEGPFRGLCSHAAGASHPEGSYLPTAAPCSEAQAGHHRRWQCRGGVFAEAPVPQSREAGPVPC